jgi:hypothetical protein
VTSTEVSGLFVAMAGDIAVDSNTGLLYTGDTDGVLCQCDLESCNAQTCFSTKRTTISWPRFIRVPSLASLWWTAGCMCGMGRYYVSIKEEPSGEWDETPGTTKRHRHGQESCCHYDFGRVDSQERKRYVGSRKKRKNMKLSWRAFLLTMLRCTSEAVTAKLTCLG